MSTSNKRPSPTDGQSVSVQYGERTIFFNNLDLKKDTLSLLNDRVLEATGVQVPRQRIVIVQPDGTFV